MAQSRTPQPLKNTVCIAFIHPGECSAYFTTSLVATLLYDTSRGPNRHVTGLLNEWSSANVSAARNSLTANFLDEKDADWLLWIDADMGWEPDAIDQLLAAADPKTAPIVGGLCFGMASGSLFPTIYQMAMIDGHPTTIRVEDYPDDSLVPCAATGAAFLLIHRTVLIAIRDAKFNTVFPWFQETQIGPRPAGEDITFCLRAGQLDFPVHVHTGVKVGHHKSQLLTAELFREKVPVVDHHA